MHEYALNHLSDSALLRDLAHLVRQDRALTARIVAHLGEVDARRLYAPAGHPSMFAYCVEELRFSEDAAYKRIRVARAARQFPELFAALADGRLHLAAASLLAPHLTRENAGRLIEAATHRSKAQVESWLAQRFAAPIPSGAPSAVIRPIAGLAPGRVAGVLGDLLAGTLSAATNVLSMGLDRSAGQTGLDGLGQPARLDGPAQTARLDGSVQTARLDGPGQTAGFDVGPGHPVGLGASASPIGSSTAPIQPPLGANTAFHEGQLAPGRVEPAALPVEERYSVHLTIPKSTHDKLRHAQALLSHAIPSGDVVQVLDRALDALISRLETRKIGSQAGRPRSSRPRDGASVPRSHAASNRRARPGRIRYIPARVRRAVWERDRGQCTFVTPSGHRCSARRFLEFDHVQPLARGGKATVEGLRLRCRAHNQHAAEQSFGTEFMKHKRELARAERAVRREWKSGAKDQPDHVREPSGVWRITQRSGVGQTPDGRRITQRSGVGPGVGGSWQLAPGRVPAPTTERTRSRP